MQQLRSIERSSELVKELVQSWNRLRQPLALPCSGHNLSRLASWVQGVTRKYLPVIEHTLREGLSTSVATEISSEACGLRGYN